MRQMFFVVLLPDGTVVEPRVEKRLWCDLLKRELKIAPEDLEKIRKSDKAEAKNTCHMLRAALGSARHYLSENSRQS
jgi:hypothetical protein